jgi:hypothetical protein
VCVCVCVCLHFCGRFDVSDYLVMCHESFVANDVNEIIRPTAALVVSRKFTFQTLEPNDGAVNRRRIYCPSLHLTVHFIFFFFKYVSENKYLCVKEWRFLILREFMKQNVNYLFRNGTTFAEEYIRGK